MKLKQIILIFLSTIFLSPIDSSMISDFEIDRIFAIDDDAKNPETNEISSREEIFQPLNESKYDFKVLLSENNEKLILVSPKETETNQDSLIGWPAFASIFTVVAALFGIIYKMLNNSVDEKKLRNSEYIKDLAKKIDDFKKVLQEENEKNQTLDKESRVEIIKTIDENIQKIEALKKEYYECNKLLSGLEANTINNKEHIASLRSDYRELGKKIDELMQSILNMNMHMP